MAHDVFISYSSVDKIVADALCARLEQNGIRCWVAPRDAAPGIEYAESLLDAIDKARVMVLVFSSHSNSSHHVRREVERAASKGLAILPLRIEDVLPDRAMEFFLASTHWLDALTPPLEQHLDGLVNAVQVVLGRSRSEKSTAARAKQAHASKPAPSIDPIRRTVAQVSCKEANEALAFALVGILCCPLLQPLAIIRALKAQKVIEANPSLAGSGKAATALAIGIAVLSIQLLYFLGIMVAAMGS